MEDTKAAATTAHSEVQVTALTTLAALPPLAVEVHSLAEDHAALSDHILAEVLMEVVHTSVEAHMVAVLTVTEASEAADKD